MAATLDDVADLLRELIQKVDELNANVRSAATDESYFINIRDDVQAIRESLS